MNIPSTVKELKRALALQGTSARAQQEKTYLKSDLEFLGVSVPAVRRQARSFTRAHAELDRKDLVALIDALWPTGVHELRSLGIGILELRADLLRKEDLWWLGGLIDSADTWAHVDWLSVKVVGALLARYPSLEKKLDRWARHHNFWVRRASLLALHDPLLAGQGDFDAFARLAVPMLAEKEFFIRKAIGWVLRSAARRQPERTYEFAAQHAKEMAGLTFKEATRVLPLAQQKRLKAIRLA